MKRIAVGGFQHETNTFAPHRAPYSEFERADSWPGLTRGADLFDSLSGLNLPLGGFIDAARPESSEAFGKWIESNHGCPRMVILGDLFDAWVGPAHARLGDYARARAVALELMQRLGADARRTARVAAAAPRAG